MGVVAVKNSLHVEDFFAIFLLDVSQRLYTWELVFIIHPSQKTVAVK